MGYGGCGMRNYSIPEIIFFVTGFSSVLIVQVVNNPVERMVLTFLVAVFAGMGFVRFLNVLEIQEKRRTKVKR